MSRAAPQAQGPIEEAGGDAKKGAWTCDGVDEELGEEIGAALHRGHLVQRRDVRERILPVRSSLHLDAEPVQVSASADHDRLEHVRALRDRLGASGDRLGDLQQGTRPSAAGAGRRRPPM